MALTLQVKLLGEFSITYDNRSVAGINTARSQALLAYLLLHRHTPQPRQRLAFHLWADSTDTQARTNLRKELSHLRRGLPQADQFLAIETKTLQWSPTAPFSLDVLEFEDALKTAETSDSDTRQAWLKQGITLYKGDLLPGCEDEWIAPERERLQQMYVNALEQLIDQLQKQQDYRSALNYAQQLLRLDSFNEATYCTLMRLYSRSGDRANALQVYHRCMTVLREELGVDPSSTTRKLYEQLLLEDESPAEVITVQTPVHLQLSPTLKSSVSLVGRKCEWDLIQAWKNVDPHDASSQLLLLIGEPGIGKTRLLEELRETVPVALWGRGFAAEMVRPYGIWIDALRSVTLPAAIPPELGFLLPEVGQPSTIPPDRSHLFDAVVQLLAQWATQNPLFVVLDDIQWIDEASSALLHYATRLLSHLSVKFACTARSGELSGNAAISQVVQALRREQRLKTVELQAFDRGETAELIRTANVRHSFDLSVEIVDQVFTDSGGNPLFVLEITRALSAHALLQSQSTHVDTLEALISDRLQQLDSSVREVLSWAAALGRSFKPAMVAQVAGYPLTQLLTAIEQLERQSIIRPSTNEMGYDFAHDVVRQVVYRQLSEPRRQLIHLQIAQQLNQSATSDNALAGDIAHHAALGGDHELAASAALLAAERCLKLFAYAEASTLAERGIQHCQSLNQQTRIHLKLSLLRVQAIAGVAGDRVMQLEADIYQLMDEANRLGLKEDEAIGLEALGTLHFNQNNFIDVHLHSQRAVEIGRAASPATAARLLAFSGSCLSELGQDMVRAEALLLEAQSLAARVGLELCDISSGLGSIYLHNGDYEAARTLLQQAWQKAKIEQDHWRECNCLCYLVMTELEAGDCGAALTYCQERSNVAAKIQEEGIEAIVTVALTALVNYRLQKQDAEIAVAEAIMQLKQADVKRMMAYVLIEAAAVDLEHQRFAQVVERAEFALETAQVVQHPTEVALAWILLIQGLLGLNKPEQAVAHFTTWNHKIHRHVLSVRTQTALDRVMQDIQSVTQSYKSV